MLVVVWIHQVVIIASVRTTIRTTIHSGSRYISKVSLTKLLHFHNVEQAKREFTGLNFQVETGSRYLASFIREVTERYSWIPSKVDDWVHNIKNLAGAARANPQRKYSALQRSVQQEWQRLQRTLNHALIY